MVRYQFALARENQKTHIAGLHVVIGRIACVPLAHIHVEPTGHDLRCSAKGSVVCDEQQRSAAAHPLTNRVALFFGEGGLAGVGHSSLEAGDTASSFQQDYVAPYTV